MIDVRVARLSLAPVKGLALVHHDAIELTRQGARGDRCFHLVDAAGRMLNGKRCGALATVASHYDESRDTLRLAFPDGSAIEGEMRTGAAIETVFFGRPVAGHVVEGPWAAALSAVAGEAVRLVRPDHPGAAADRGHTVTLVSAASLARLAADAGLGEALDARRLRMSIEVEGTEPYAEDAWVGRRVAVGAATVLVRGNVGRCVVTSHDPDRGVPDTDVLGALAVHRSGVSATEPLPLGVWGEVDEPGLVLLGDAVNAV